MITVGVSWSLRYGLTYRAQKSYWPNDVWKSTTDGLPVGAALHAAVRRRRPPVCRHAAGGRPVFDTRTDNLGLLNDEMYLGNRYARVPDFRYDELIDAFMTSVAISR